MTLSSLRLLRPLFAGGVLATGILLLNCSSDPAAKIENPADSATPTDSDVTALDAGPDTSSPDAAAPVTQAELSVACLDGNTRNFLHCYGDVTKAGFSESLPADCDTRAANLFLPGITDAARVAQKACEDSRGTFCSGISPACRALAGFVGTLPDSTACQDSLQCSSGLCLGATDTLCGVCTQPLPTGGDCSGANSKRCARSAACDKACARPT